MIAAKDVYTILHYRDQRDFVQAGGRVIALVELGWTRREVAKSLGVSPVSLRNWANAAKNAGVHAIFDDLSSPRSPKKPTNYALVHAQREFSPEQRQLIRDLHSSTKGTRAWKDYKNLLTYLVSIRYRITHIGKTLNDTSATHVKSLLTDSTDSPFIEDFHARPLDLPHTDKNFILYAKEGKRNYELYRLLPRDQILFTPSQVSALSPPIPDPVPFPDNPSSVIIDTDTPYLVPHEKAISLLGITNTEKESD